MKCLIVIVCIGGGGIIAPPRCFGVEPTHPDAVISDEKTVLKKAGVIFRKLFFSDAYNSLKCQDNAYNLTRKLQHANLDLSQITILFIFDRDHDKLLQTNGYGVQRHDFTVYRTRHVATRKPPPNHFHYHVFVMVQQQVFDFDYTDSPTVTPARSYFDAMYTDGRMTWKEKKVLFNRLILRTISACDYLKSFPQHPSYYLFDLDKKYPAQTLRSFIASLPPEEKDTDTEAEE